MAGSITLLRYQKRTTERVNVYLDGEYAFALPAMEAARLKVGQFLTDPEIAGLQTLDTHQKAYDRAVHFLGVRPRSIAEVRRRLSEAGFESETVEDVLTRLAAQGYLNDADFARYWVENRQRFRPKGAQALRQELRQKGLDRDTVAEALVDLDSVEAAYRAAQPRAGRLAALAGSDPAAYRRKIGDFLLRRGFDYATVREVVNRLMREMDVDIETGENPPDEI